MFFKYKLSATIKVMSVFPIAFVNPQNLENGSFHAIVSAFMCDVISYTH